MGLRACPECDGTGEYWFNRTGLPDAYEVELCQRCDGTGLVEAKPQASVVSSRELEERWLQEDPPPF